MGQWVKNKKNRNKIKNNKNRNKDMNKKNNKNKNKKEGENCIHHHNNAKRIYLSF